MNNQELPIAIIGAGPVGLAAAAQLALRHQAFLVFESGSQAGSNISSWGHVQLFSPWKYNMDKAATELFRKAKLPIPDADNLPFGHQIVSDYLVPLSQLPTIKKSIHFNSSVRAVGRKGLDKMKNANREQLPFVLQVVENGYSKTYEARAVIDASGTWHNPNPIGSGGLFAIGELENQKQIQYGIPDILNTDKNRYANRTTLVVGSGHSAIGSIIALHQLKRTYPQTQIHWILRKDQISSVYGGQEADQFEARGALGMEIQGLVDNEELTIHTPVHVHQIERADSKLRIHGSKNTTSFSLGEVDEIICSTGARPDFRFLREVRHNQDAALESVAVLAPLIDPNVHSCGTVRPHGEAELRQPEKDFYIVGVKSYGRAPTFLMTTGYEQVRSIISHLLGDYESAKRVELKLPETGVCSFRIPMNQKSQSKKCVSTPC